MIAIESLVQDLHRLHAKLKMLETKYDHADDHGQPTQDITIEIEAVKMHINCLNKRLAFIKTNTHL